MAPAPPAGRCLPAEAQAALRQALDTAGCRYTRQRAAVYAYLHSVHTHPTAEEVYRAVQVRVPNISLATVYKALDALVQCQLAQKLTSSAGPTRYDCRTDHHYHMRCVRTGQIRDLDVQHDPSLLAKLAPDLVERLRSEGFTVTDYRLELLGEFSGSSPPTAPPAS
ncbi:MAG TPA: transcriptional repressor [Gemmatales bacterium]|nr:transcriptional repressor [Gemmatales bacterium]